MPNRNLQPIESALASRVTETLGSQGQDLFFDAMAEEVGPVEYDRTEDQDFQTWADEEFELGTWVTEDLLSP